jgi:hypothetical protein
MVASLSFVISARIARGDRVGEMPGDWYTYFAFELLVPAGSKLPLKRLMRQTYARAFLAIPDEAFCLNAKAR